MVTDPERLAKVAEVLSGHRYDPVRGWACTCGEDFASRMDFTRPAVLDVTTQFATLLAEHQAEVLAPLLDEFQAEAEVRGAARVREAVEAVIREHGQQQIAGHVWTRDDYLRAALDGAEKAAVEPVAGAVSAEDGLSGRGDAGRGAEVCGLEFGDGYTCDLPKGHE